MASEESVTAVISATRQTLRTRHDKVAYAVNAAFIAAGYDLRFTRPFSVSDDTEYAAAKEGINPNELLGHDYTYLYSNPEKDIGRILVKCLVVDDKMLVYVLTEGGAEPMHLELDVEEYVEDTAGSAESQLKNLGKLVASVQKEFLDKLDSVPALSSSSSQPSRSCGITNASPGLGAYYDNVFCSVTQNKLLNCDSVLHLQLSKGVEIKPGQRWSSYNPPKHNGNFPGPILQAHPFDFQVHPYGKDNTLSSRYVQWGKPSSRPHQDP